MSTPFRRMFSAALALLAWVLLAAGPPARAAEPLVADLSRHLVAITTGFSGTDVLLFGSAEGDGDVIVVVRGPNHTQVIRRKDRQAGIWVNAGRAQVENVPSFYRVAATRPLADIAPPQLLDDHQIGLDHLDLAVRDTAGHPAAPQFRNALVRLEQRAGLWGDKVQKIGFLGHQLFRTEVHFPANVPVGTYLVEVYLVAQGKILSAQTTPLVISKIGLGADIFDFAHQHAAVYGIIAIVLAAATGWLAAVALKKG